MAKSPAALTPAVGSGMAGDTRQQRRRIERERRKLGERVLARGLGPQPTRDEVLGVAEVLYAKLRDGCNPRRASEAAGLAQRLSARSLQSHPSIVQIACAKGCSFCCHGFVGALPPEAFRIADAVRQRRAGPVDAETVHAAAIRLIGLSPEERVGRKLPCPLLDRGMCSVYDVRPLVCRQTTSLSLSACEEEFEGIDPDGRVEISSVHLAHASNAHVALLGAMRAAGLPSEAYELGALLEVVLRTEDCEQRWLDGEPLFVQLKGVVRRQPNVEMVAQRIATALND